MKLEYVVSTLRSWADALLIITTTKPKTKIFLQNANTFDFYKTIQGPEDVNRLLLQILEYIIWEMNEEFLDLSLNFLSPFMLNIIWNLDVLMSNTKAFTLMDDEIIHSSSKYAFICLFISKISCKIKNLRGVIYTILCKYKRLFDFSAEYVSASILATHLSAVRVLHHNDCLDCDNFRSIIGNLIMLTKSSDVAIRYHSINLICDHFHIAPSVKLNHISTSCSENADILSALIYNDSQIYKSSATDIVPHLVQNIDSMSTISFANLYILGNQIVCVGNYTIPIFSTSTAISIHDTKITNEIIETETTKKNFLEIGRAVLSNCPVIVQGEVGCGKSFIIHQLAKLLGQDNTLIELHFDDQTDGKSLIGSYVCSDIPGEFIWQAGVIAQAVTRGSWLVLENIDKVPLDIIASLSSILEKRRIFLPNKGREYNIHPGFRIFGTRVVERNQESSSYLHNFKHFSSFCHFVEVQVPHIEEIRLILMSKYPTLLPIIVQQLIQVYTLFNTDIKDNKNLMIKMKQRQFTLRDLMKVAGRLTRYSDEYNYTSGILTSDQQIIVINEIIDVFVASIRDRTIYIETTFLIASMFGMSESDVDALIINATPIQHANSSKASSNDQILNKNYNWLTIGRVMIPIQRTNLCTDVGQNFALTKYSLRMLERVAICVIMNEPVLLVGETGAGKTSSVQELARLTCNKLIVQNLSLSTDTSDLLGGFRPVTMRQLFLPTYELFVQLFQQTFSSSQNVEFLQVVAQSFQKEQWKKLLMAFEKACKNAIQKEGNNGDALAKWNDLLEKVSRFIASLPRIEYGFAFAFQEGLLVQAMKNGNWILLDEINLATPETLQGISGIIEGKSICLTDRGDIKLVERHPNFRIFAAMNPPTDIGKKELPVSLRCRFTEIYADELTDKQDLATVVTGYLSDQGIAPIEDIVSTYLECREMSNSKLEDSAGQRPRFSLRSLTRSLRAANKFMSLGIRPFNRALFEGFLLNFQTLLGEASRIIIWRMLNSKFNVDSRGSASSSKDLSLPFTRPGGKKSSADDWVLVKPFWLKVGPNKSNDWCEKDEYGITRFVMTKTVESTIRDIVAAIVSNVAPILLQGPTSVGKTTMIEYIAAKAGFKCIRINNHEHTDIQEYIGGYTTNIHGQLEFRDGLLVEALRNGHWIILDELNLAPSDVLEALNRLLDDNTELLIPETGEVIKPASGFTLFATQNPAGAYGGRKPLSRAFRNRFLEIFVNDLPFSEVEEIITQSCGIPPKFSQMLVKTMQDLKLRRQKSSLFQGKHGSVTTRDLIKWGKRQPATPYSVAMEGYMLLAERLRSDEEKSVVENILNANCKVKLDFSLSENYSASISEVDDIAHKSTADLHLLQKKLRENDVTVDGVVGIAITEPMKRMWKLVNRCVDHNEPVLLIGETGCGKTTVCQLVAAQRNQHLKILNCHQSTETADIIGGLRPVRNRKVILEFVLTELKLVIDSMIATNIIPCVTDNKKSVQELVSGPTDMLLIDDTLIKSLIDAVGKANREYLDAASANEAEAVEAKAKRIKTGNPNDEQSNPAIPSHSPWFSRLKTVEDEWIRYKSLFEWQDGPLVSAMKHGDMFLLDEINLADDAVIERLNSVLESGREITLVEKGGLVSEKIVAHPNFKFFATMNPSGDFGKRELSPALRSRFTEIWIPQVHNRQDIIQIVKELLHINLVSVTDTSSLISNAANIMVTFLESLNMKSKSLTLNGISFSVRDVLAWAKFISQWNPSDEGLLYCALLHGAFMIFFDGLGIGLTIQRDVIRHFKAECVEYLIQLCPNTYQQAIRDHIRPPTSGNSYIRDSKLFTLGCFSINSGKNQISVTNKLTYTTNAPSTLLNLNRILRAMQIKRPILLEGPPGVGKSSLIANLAAIAGHKLVRINLSEHTEISDLLGTDLPISSDDTGSNTASQSSVPKFSWCDGVFLKAMKEGDWVLLDELNLAPQSVLEGLNACFDHREQVFLPEIGKSVICPSTFRVFCAQNPMVEGGGRKGLPQSFLSRFSRVYVESISEDDMKDITLQSFAKFSSLSVNDNLGGARVHKLLESNIPLMVKFILKLQSDIIDHGVYGRIGGPWEFNLRDIFRWCEIIISTGAKGIPTNESLAASSANELVCNAAYILFMLRMRTYEDKHKLSLAFAEVFNFPLRVNINPVLNVANDQIRVGLASISVTSEPSISSSYADSNYFNYQQKIFGPLRKPLEGVASCIALSWPVLLVGSSGSGKKRILRQLAILSGNFLFEFSATFSTDSTDLLGSFEQRNVYRHLSTMLYHFESSIAKIVASFLLKTGACNHTNSVIQVNDLLAEIVSIAHKVVEENSINLEIGSSLIRKIEELDSLLTAIISSSEFSHHAQALDYCKLLFNNFKACYSASRRGGSLGFEWVDGVIINCIENGFWLLIDNVNLCPASVLDRLNSLLETDGSILLTENGIGKSIKPHPNFRIILIMDPIHGEISRAMRNRCVEIAVSSSIPSENEHDLDAALAQLVGWSDNNLPKTNDFLHLNMRLYSLAFVNTSRLSTNVVKYRVWNKFYDVMTVTQNSGCSTAESFAVAKKLLASYFQSMDDELLVYSVEESPSSWTGLHSTYALSGLLPPHVFSCLVGLDYFRSLLNDSSLPFNWMKSWYTNVCLSVYNRFSVNCNSDPELLLQYYRDFRVDKFGLNEAIACFIGNFLSSVIKFSTEDDFNSTLWQFIFQKILLRNEGTVDDTSSSDEYRYEDSLTTAFSYESWIVLLQKSPLLAKFTSLDPIFGEKILPLWSNFINVTVKYRFHVMMMEENTKKYIDGLMTITNFTKLPSLFAYAYAYGQHKLVAETKEMVILSVILNICNIVDTLVYQSIHNLSQERLLDVFTQLKDIIGPRDMLSLILLAQIDHNDVAQDYLNKSMVIPWDGILISCRWISKRIYALLNYLQKHDSTVDITYIETAHREMNNFYKTVAEYWRRPYVNPFEKWRLWNEGGHAAVPTKVQDWDTLRQIRKLVKMCEHQLSCGLDTTVPICHGKSRQISIYSGMVNRDLLAIYSTFYWSKTNESSNLFIENKISKNVDVDNIITALASKIATNAIQDEIEYDLEGNVIFTEPLNSLIEHEVSTAGNLSLALLMEPIVLNAYMEVSNILGYLTSHNSIDSSLLSRIATNCKYIIECSLQYTLFSPLVLRELQTLQWIAEAIIISKVDSKEFLLLAKRLMVAIDSNVMKVLDYNLMNHATAIEFTYSSKTLKRIMTESDDNLAKAETISLPWISALYSGVAKLMQPTFVYNILRHVDARIINPQYGFNNGLLRIINYNTASVNISSCKNAVKHLYKLFQVAIDGLSTSPSFLNAFPRKNVLIDSCINIIKSAKDFFTDDDSSNIAVQIQSFSGDCDAEHFVQQATTLCSFLMEQKLYSKCSNSFLGSIFERCLQPLLTILANNLTYTENIENSVLLAKCWIYIGLLKAHLSLPITPIDPATKPFIKASLISREKAKLNTLVLVQTGINAFCDGNVLSDETVFIMDTIGTSDRKISSLDAKAIERPADARNFIDLFQDLQSSVAVLCNVDSVLSLVKNFSASYEDIVSLIGSQRLREKYNLMLNFVREEINWQTSISSFVSILREHYSEYEDITSPIISALFNVSSGMRVIAGWFHGLSADIVSTGTTYGTTNVNTTWKNILQFPFGLGINQDVNFNSIAGIKELLAYSDQLIKVSKQSLIADNVEHDATYATLPQPEVMDIIAPQAVLLLSLAKFNYLVSSETISPIETDACDLFESVLRKFVEFYGLIEERRRKKEEEDSSYFKNKLDSKVFESNDAKEEEMALRLHFPDHLSDFKDMIKGGTNEAVADVHKEQSKLSVSYESIMDDHTFATLVSYHARMMLLYIPSHCANNNILWKKRYNSITLEPKNKSNSKKQKQATGAGYITGKSLISHKEQICRELFDHSLSTAKSFDHGLRTRISPYLDTEIVGGSLMSIASMIDTISCSPSNSLNSSVNYLVDNAGTTNSSAVDRDLLLLIDPFFNGCWRPKNFHCDAYYEEVAHARDCLQKMFTRATSLLVMFPGNEILTNLCKICSRILEFHATTSLGKMLISIELLLKQSQEWEQYAAKHVSVTDEITQLSTLIMKWRKIELKSWEDILRHKEISYSTSTTRHWFTLARALHLSSIEGNVALSKDSNIFNLWPAFALFAPTWVIAGVFNVSSKDQNVDTTYLMGVFDLLDKFIRLSVVGSFPTRLHLIRIFSIQLLQNVNSNQESLQHIRMFGSMVYTLWRYYDQFLPIVRNFQEILKNPIEQKIKDEVKIGKWDQYGSYAVLEASEKTHRKLNKFITEYQCDVLDYPVAALLRKELVGHLVSEQGELEVAPDIPAMSIIFPSLSNYGDAIDTKIMNINVSKSEDAQAETGEFSQDDASMSTEIDVDVNLIDISEIILSRGRRSSSLSFGSDGDDLLIANTIKDNYPRIFRGKDLCNKMDSYLNEVFVMSDAAMDCRFNKKARTGLHIADYSENICNEIFLRISVLRKAGTPKVAKHRAMNDLLQSLHKSGVSHLKVGVPSEMREMIQLMCIPSPLAVEMASNLRWSSAKPMDLFERAESYYLRNLAELNELRTQVSSPIAKDVSYREAQLMLGLSENLFANTISIRCTLGASLADMRDLQISLKQIISNLCVSNTYDGMKCSYDSLVQKSHELLDIFVQFRILLTTSKVSKHIDEATSSTLDDKAVTVYNDIVISIDEIIRKCKDYDNLDECCISVSPALATIELSPNNPSHEKITDCIQYAAAKSTSMLKYFESIHGSLRSLLTNPLVDSVQRKLLLYHEFIASLDDKTRGDNLSGTSTAKDAVPDEILSSVSSCIDTSLVAIQKIRTFIENSSAQGEGEEPEDQIHISNSVKRLIHQISELSVRQITARVREVLTLVAVSKISKHTLVVLESSFIPIIQRIICAFGILIDDMTNAFKSTSKLLYVSLRVFRTILSKGLCSAETQEGDGDGDGDGDASGMKFEDDVDGTGMGEGDGRKDVSDQIDNEEQLLGLKDENPKPEKKNDKAPLSNEEKDTGVEMSQDFDGDYHDLPEEDEDKENEDEMDEGEELDREMGDTGMENIVDEKQWNDEESDDEGEDKSKNEKLEQDSKMSGDKIDETITNDNDDGEDAKDDSNNEGNNVDQKSKEIENEKEDKPEINEDFEDNYADKPVGVDVREDEQQDFNENDEMDEADDGDDRNQDDNNVEIPDGMNLDQDDANGDDEEDGDGESVLSDNEVGDNGSNEDSLNDENSMDDDDNNNEDDKDQLMTGSGNMNDLDLQEQEQEQNNEGEKQESNKSSLSKKPPTFGVNAENPTDSVLGTEDNEIANQMEEDMDNTGGPHGHGGDSNNQGKKGVSHEQGDRNRDDINKSQKIKDAPNPFKNTGDINEKWHRRLNILDTDAVDEEEMDTTQDKNDAGTDDHNNGLYEQASKEQGATEQTLSSVKEENATSLPDNSSDSERLQQNDDINTLMDTPEDKKRPRRDEPNKERKRLKEGNDITDDNEMDETTLEKSVDVTSGKDDTKEEVNDEISNDQWGFSHTDPKVFDEKERFDNTEGDVSDDEAIDLIYFNNKSAADFTSARIAWNNHRVATESFSIRLCEQLRLILEPTLRTRLRGDYRTGKRINMRKVISYVASGFRKDKIWLRRTKPAKRDYQIMIMIDNSSSMGEAGPLALSSLALISNALTRLETGDICVASFAEEVEIIHPFGIPFNDEAGASVLSKFEFTAQRTLLGKSLEAVTSIFTSARNNSVGSTQSGITLQLCFVISDARIDSDNRIRLDSVIKKLSEQHVLVVLIIIDKNSDPKLSILNTKTVEFKGDKVVTTSYLDNFPFPYYMAIQNLDALPDVLSDALKQWFQLVQMQLDK